MLQHTVKIQCINTSIINIYVSKYYFTIDNSLELSRDFEKSGNSEVKMNAWPRIYKAILNKTWKKHE